MASRARNGTISQSIEDKTPTSASSPPRKRQRVSRACDQCRASREKCNGESPCVTCTNHGRDCTWNTPKKTRGLKTGYIRTLESALGWIFENSPDVEQALHHALSNKYEPTEKLLQNWKTSSVRKKIEQLVSKGEQANHESSSDGEGRSLTSRFSTAPSTTLTATSTLSVSPLLPENTLRLLDIYFSYTHNWFPILDKTLIQKAVWSYSNRQGSDIVHSPELWALLALVSCQEESLRTTPTPNELYTFARSLLFREGKSDSSHVKALLLLTLINIGRNELENAWVLIGFACNLRFHLGNDWRSKYVLMGCALLDVLVSTQLGRPRHLREDIELPLEVDVQDEWEEWTPCMGFGTQSSGRFPARSISSFRSLFCLHFRGTFDVNSNQNGTPSASILRVASSSVQEGRFMLAAIDDYVNAFGVYAMPPLFSYYMAQIQNIADLSADENRRWSQYQNTVHLLYTGGTQLPKIHFNHQPVQIQPLTSARPIEDQFNLAQTFGLDTNLDYDAIMNEIGLADSRDMNTQFMMNLGYGPDSSIDDMFSYGYGHTRLT